MASMKTMMMCVVDVGSTMGDYLEPAKAAKLTLGKSFISTYIVQRMMASKTVEFGVVTYGSSETNNFLNNSQGGYENVVEQVEMGKPTVADITSIMNIQTGEDKGDLIDGIVVGQDVLIRVNNKKAYNRIMLIVTDGETEVSGVEDLEVIVGQMKQITNFGLYIAMLGKVDEHSSVVKRENAKLMQSLAESANGRFMEVQDVGDSCHLLSTGLGLGTRPQASKIILELSGSLRVPCQTWGKVSKATVPSLKKKAKTANGAGGGGRARGDEDDEGAAAAVKRDTTYRNPEDPDQELGPEERVKGYKYGSQYVPIAAADEDLFKVPGAQGVKILGFIPAASVPRHHYMESPMILQGAADNDSAQVAICALATAVRQSGMVALARFVKRENSDPFLAVLMPTDEPGDSALLIHRLPCCEDIREYAFPSLIAFGSAAQVQASPALKDQSTAMNSLVDSLTIKPVPTTALAPINFTLQEVYTDIYRRLVAAPAENVVHANDPLSGTPPPTVHGYNADAIKAAQAAVAGSFELVKNESAAGSKRKVYWSELDIKGADGEAAPAAAEAVRVRYDMDLNALGGAAGAGGAAAPAVQLPEFTVGSVTALEDFQAVVEAAPQMGAGAPDVIRGAMRTMMDIVDRNISIGASNAHYRRAVACIGALRKAALTEGEHSMFNNFMRDRVKQQYSAGRHRAVWQMVVDEALTLISTEDDSGSEVSPQEARNFLTEERVAAPVAAAAAVEEEEDMFGNMA